jgi:ribosome-associated translation inhibitor RaiA
MNEPSDIARKWGLLVDEDCRKAIDEATAELRSLIGKLSEQVAEYEQRTAKAEYAAAELPQLRERLATAETNWSFMRKQCECAIELRKQAQERLAKSEHSTSMFLADIALLKQERDKSEAANAAMRKALQGLYDETADYIRTNHLGDVHHNKSMQDVRDALSTDAGRDYVPKEQVEEAWRKGMTEVALLVESLIESDLTESRNPINVCRQIHNDLILTRDAKKESAK